MLGLVSEGEHPKCSAKGSAYQCRKKQYLFRYAPRMMRSFILVYAHQDKAKYVYCCNVGYYDLYYFHLLFLVKLLHLHAAYFT